MKDKYMVHESSYDFQVRMARGEYREYFVASFWKANPECPNAEREARNLCLRLNAAAKKGKGKR